MIYYENHALFIHIPRTSGVALTATVARQQDPENTAMNIILGGGLGRFNRHSQAHSLRSLLKDWDTLDKFTVMRNPWRIIESTYRYFHQKLQHIDQGRCRNNQSFKQFLETGCGKSFAEFVPWHFYYLKQGFYDHWALTWDTQESLGVTAYKYEELDQHWPEICEIMLIPKTTVRLHENHAAHFPVAWTSDAIDFVQQRCELDFTMFDYPRHP